MRRQRNEEMIRAFLQRELADVTFHVAPLPRHGGLQFRFSGGAKSVWFSDAFLEDTEPDQLSEQLATSNVAARLQGLAAGHILRITNDGIDEWAVVFPD